MCYFGLKRTYRLFKDFSKVIQIRTSLGIVFITTWFFPFHKWKKSGSKQKLQEQTKDASREWFSINGKLHSTCVKNILLWGFSFKILFSLFPGSLLLWLGYCVFQRHPQGNTFPFAVLPLWIFFIYIAAFCYWDTLNLCLFVKQ